MNRLSITIFTGVILAIPFIYFLSLDNPGAITLLIFLCVGLVATVWSLIKLVFQKKRKEKV
jgi:hypothetical protein